MGAWSPNQPRESERPRAQRFDLRGGVRAARSRAKVTRAADFPGGPPPHGHVEQSSSHPTTASNIYPLAAFGFKGEELGPREPGGAYLEGAIPRGESGRGAGRGACPSHEGGEEVCHCTRTPTRYHHNPSAPHAQIHRFVRAQGVSGAGPADMKVRGSVAFAKGSSTCAAAHFGRKERSRTSRSPSIR